MNTAAKLRSYHPRGDLGAASRVDKNVRGESWL